MNFVKDSVEVQINQIIQDKILASVEADTREVRALHDAAAQHPRASQWLLTLESRLPFPKVPAPIQILPAWQWMLTAPHF